MHPAYIGPKCQLDGIVKRFYQEVYERGVYIDKDVMITFSEKMNTCILHDNAVGCTYGLQKVEILATYWVDVDCELREALVYHELGHAILRLGHKDHTLMDPYVEKTRDCLQSDRNACLDEALNRYLARDWYF